MTDQPVSEAAIQCVAENMLRRYESEYQTDHLSWRDFVDDAREDLEAAAPHIRAAERERLVAWLRANNNHQVVIQGVVTEHVLADYAADLIESETP